MKSFADTLSTVNLSVPFDLHLVGSEVKRGHHARAQGLLRAAKYRPGFKVIEKLINDRVSLAYTECRQSCPRGEEPSDD